MSLTDSEAASDSMSHSPPDDESKWVDVDEDSNELKKSQISDNSSNSKKTSKSSFVLSSVSKISKSSKSNESKNNFEFSYSEDESDQDKKKKDKDKKKNDEKQKKKKNISDRVSMEPENSKKNLKAPSIQIALSGNKIVYSNGEWHDVTDMKEASEAIHPIVAENISLKKRAELLVRLIAESEYEIQLIQSEMEEVDDIISKFKEIIGENESTKTDSQTSEDSS